MIDKWGCGRALASVIGLTALMGVGAAFAEPVASEGDIIVTAQRREERLQDVPVAVTAVSGATIEQSGFRSLADLQYLVPSLQYNAYNGAGFQIRGIGSQGFDFSLDQSVGIMIDGVVQGIPRDPGLNSLTDIEHVEVLRGPQGTLFGKNTSAGVISITTQRPELNVWSGNSHASYGTDNETVVQGNVNIPLGAAAALRLSGSHQQRDGYVDNVLTNEDLGGSTDWSTRAKLLWEPTKDLDVYVIGSYQETRDDNNILMIRSVSPEAPGGSTVPAENAPYNISFGPGNERVADNVHPGNNYRVWGVNTTIDYRMGDYTLTSVTGYRRFQDGQSFMTDASPVNYLDTNMQSGLSSQFTQELRLTSPGTGFLTYVLGLYYFDSDISTTQLQSGLFGFPPIAIAPATAISPTGGRDHFNASSQSYAAFGQGALHVTDDLQLIFGARYTHDDVSTRYRLEPVPGIISFTAPAAPSSGSVTHDNVSIHAGLQYNFSPDLMSYFTYATGYKGPAFSNLQGATFPVRPETSDDYEAGFKSEWFNRRLTLNIAVFYQKYKDFQAQVFDTSVTPAVLRLGNAGGLESKGIEIELNARPTSALTLSAGITYARARYTDYATSCYTGQPLSGIVGEGCYIDPALGTRVQNLAGEPLSGAPDWSLNAGATYRHEVFNGLMFDANTNYVWKDDAYTVVPDRNTIVKGHGLLGLNIGLGSADGGWRLGVFARNLLDEHYVNAIFPNSFDPFDTTGGTLAGVMPGYSQFPAAEARRTVGVALDVSFGG